MVIKKNPLREPTRSTLNLFLLLFLKLDFFTNPQVFSKSPDPLETGDEGSSLLYALCSLTEEVHLITDLILKNLVWYEKMIMTCVMMMLGSICM